MRPRPANGKSGGLTACYGYAGPERRLPRFQPLPFPQGQGDDAMEKRP